MNYLRNLCLQFQTFYFDHLLVLIQCIHNLHLYDASMLNQKVNEFESSAVPYLSIISAPGNAFFIMKYHSLTFFQMKGIQP